MSQIIDGRQVLAWLLAASAPVAAVPVARGGSCTHHVATAGANSVRSAKAADLDGDGDLDIAAANLGVNQVAWYESSGGSTPTFVGHVIAGNRRASSFVICIDMDGDGDQDVISSSVNDDEITWYDNNGASTPAFTARVITVDPNDNQFMPPEGFANAVRMIDLADFDGDGDLDVCAASHDDDKVSWFANPGVPDGPWEPTMLTGGLDGARAIHAADIDGDGDPDMAAGGWYDERLLWFENQGGSPPVFVERLVALLPHTPPPAQPSMIGQIWEIASGDFDGDGDLDLASIAQFQGIEWFESDGATPPVFTHHVIRPLTQAGKSIASADLDEDGDIDLLTAERSGDRVSWFENTGGKPLFLEHALTEDPDGAGPGHGPAHGARSVATGDLDGDGDLDVLWSARDNSTIGWEENPFAAASACPGDVDADGAVGIPDLLLLLAAWSADPGGTPDLDCDGVVGILDLLGLLSAWGACPP